MEGGSNSKPEVNYPSVYGKVLKTIYNINLLRTRLQILYYHTLIFDIVYVAQL
jgi:hypothetical protein